MKRKLLCLAVFSLCFQSFSKPPLIVDLLTDFKAPVKRADGTVLGTVMVPKGTKLQVLGAKSGQLLVKKENRTFIIDAAKTNFTEALAAYKQRELAMKRRAEELKKQRLSQAAENKTHSQKPATLKAPDVIKELFGEKLVDAQKKERSVDELAGKVIGVYFSAYWCGYCREFTPKLVKFHTRMKTAGKPFEIVFVSSDKTKRDMFDYMKEEKMPWLALPFGDKHKQLLGKIFRVNGLPTLVILNEQGKAVTVSGRGDVGRLSPEDAYAKWSSE